MEDIETYIKESVELIEDCKIIWREDRPRDHFKNDRGYSIYMGRAAGREAGSINTRYNGKKYKIIKIAGKTFRYHRLVWLLYYGEWPKNQLDHIDGNSLNNHVENLRDVDQFSNARNVRKSSLNKSGVVGVSLHKKRNKWQSSATVDGKKHHLGLFDNFEDAVKARKEFERSTKAFGPNHGS